MQRSSFSRTAAHIFCFPWDAPEAITLNVVWMEREFDAYKLSRCTCPSNYNRFWDRSRYLWKKSSFYHTPLHSTPPLGEFPSGHRHPLWYGKTRILLCRYPMVKKFRRYVYSFWRDPRTWRKEGRIDRQTPRGKDRLCIASRGKNRRVTNHYTEIRWLVHWPLMGGLLHRDLGWLSPRLVSSSLYQM